MKAGDRRTLARLLKNVNGDWNELRRSYQAMPKPKRGRPPGPANSIDDYLLVTLKQLCKNSQRNDGLAPHAAIRSLMKDVERVAGRKVFSEKFGASVNSVTRRLYQKMKDGKRRRQLEQAGKDSW
jgi:hypothetical protein